MTVTLTWEMSTLELARPFRISRGVMSERAAVTVTVTDVETGIAGRGEVVTSVYAALDMHTITAQLRTVRDRWADADSVAVPRDIHPAVAAAVESAIAELHARGEGQSVAAHLGLPLLGEVPISRTVGIAAPHAMAVEAAYLSRTGVRVIKVKTDADADESIRRLVAVAAAAPGVDLIVDPNEAWTATAALNVLENLHGVPIVALEQPLRAQDRHGARELRSRTDIPVIADESVANPADLDRLDGMADAVNIKLPKCGGIYQARHLAAQARDRGLDVMLGCLVSSSLSIAPAVHLAALARWCDLDGHLLLAHDPWTGLGGEDGALRPSGAAGFGVHRHAEVEAHR